MSLDQAIANKKEKRKPYYRSGRCDKTCRPNGGCPWCRDNRSYATRKRKSAADAQIKERHGNQD